MILSQSATEGGLSQLASRCLSSDGIVMIFHDSNLTRLCGIDAVTEQLDSANLTSRFLGTSTERETVEVALELVAFRRDLAAGVRALKGMTLSRVD